MKFLLLTATLILGRPALAQETCAERLNPDPAAAHLVDAATFIDRTAARGFMSMQMEASVDKILAHVRILNPSPAPLAVKLAEVVERLATADPEALHALLVLDTVRFQASFAEVAPELTGALARLEPILLEAGVTRPDANPRTWHLHPDAAGHALSAPAAAPLLHRLTDGPEQAAKRDEMIRRRALTRDPEQARVSVARLTALRTFVREFNRRHQISSYEENRLMKTLVLGGNASPGGVILVLGEGPIPQEIITAHGRLFFRGSSSGWSKSAEYIERLGLKLLREVPGGAYTEHLRYFAVTRMPDGTAVEPATEHRVGVLGQAELKDLLTKSVPATALAKFKIQDPE
jgi:hypothetical protein